MVVGPDGALPLPWLREPLERALAGVRAHGVLLHGPGGAGPFEFALLLAQAWLCEAGPGAPAARPCGACVGCRLLQSRSHPDFHLLLPEALREPLGWAGEGEAEAGEGKKKPSREIKVEAVRAAIDWAQRSSSRGRAKVVLIHPAQAMNTVTANALLKTLEEPPGAVRLLLSTHDPQTLLPTVRSRCQGFRLAGPAEADARAWLDAQGVAGAGVLIAAAGGQPLEALALAREGLDAAFWQGLPAQVRRADAQGLAALGVPRAVNALHKLCHDLMACTVGGAPRFFPAASLPGGASLAALAAWAATLAQAARHDEHPWNAALRIEALVSEGSRAWKAAAAPQGRVATLARR